jgi:hypothetical protein
MLAVVLSAGVNFSPPLAAAANAPAGNARNADDNEDARKDQLLLICWKDKYGFIDRSGRVVVRPIYEDIHAYDSSNYIPENVARRSYSEGLRPVQLGQKWGYIDSDEKFVIPQLYDRAGPFREGLAQVRQGEKWGLIDRDGRFVVEPTYSVIGPLRNGVARVAVGGHSLEGGWPGSKWGLMDNTWKILLEPKYDMVREFDAGSALVNVGGTWAGISGLAFVGGKWGVVDRKGKFAIEPSFELPLEWELDGRQVDPAVRKRFPGVLRFAGGLAPVVIEGEWAYLDDKRRIAIPPRFNWAGPFTTALASARSGEKFGYIDRTGRWVIEPQFDRAGPFAAGLAWVKRADRFAFINEQGEEVFTVAGAEEGSAFWKGLAAVRVGSFWGFVNSTGQWVHRPRFQEIRPYTETLQQVKADGKWGLINSKGELVCPPKYEWFGGFQPTGRALFGNGQSGAGAELGMIDSNGRMIFEPVPGREFSEALEESAKKQIIFPRHINFRWGFVDRAGEFVIEPQYRSVEPLGQGMASVRDQTREGLVDLRTGKLVCPPQYLRIDRFSEGLAAFTSPLGGNAGYLDRTGKVVIKPQFRIADPFSDGIAAVSSYDSMSRLTLLYINRDGKYLWAPSGQ